MLAYLTFIDNGSFNFLEERAVGISNRVLHTISPNLPKIRTKGISLRYLDYLLNKLSFESLSKGRTRGTVNPKSHYRQGQEGDWKNHLNAEHLAYFDEKFPNLLKKLGYSS